jgi:hypothetical protein
MLFLYPVSEMNIQLTWLNETKACTILQGNPFGKHVCLSSKKRKRERERLLFIFISVFVSTSYILKLVALCCYA